MATLAELIVRIGGDITGVSSAFKATKGLINGLARDFSKSAADFERLGQGMSQAGRAIAQGLGSSVSTAATFEQQMSKVQALSGGTSRDFNALRDAAIDLGSKTVFSASQAAEGMQNFAAAGLKTSDIIAAMPGLLDAASAGGLDLAGTSDLMVTALSGFGLEARQAGHVADVLAAAANASAIGMTDIGFSMKYAAPVAKAAGISIEEVASALVIMGNAGIKGETAGTTFRSAMVNLLNPGKNAAAVIHDLGMQFTDANGKLLPLSAIIGEVQAKTEGLTQSQRLAAIATLFGKTSMAGMLTLMEAGVPKINALTQEFIGADGTARTMASTMTDNLLGAVEQAKGAFESFQIIVGTALTPAIRFVTMAIQGAFEAFNALPLPMQQTLAISAAVTSGVMLLGGGLMLLVAMVPSALNGFASLAGVFAAITSPMGLMITAMGLVVGALVYLVATNEHVQTELESIWDSISSIFDSSLTFIVNIADSYLGEFAGLWGASMNGIQSVTDTVWFNIVDLATNALNFISDILYAVSQAMQGNWRAAMDGMLAASFDLSQIGVDVSNLGAMLGAAWEGIKTAALYVWDAIKEGIKSRINGIINLINAFTSRISGMVLFSIPAEIGLLNPALGQFTGDYRMPMIPAIPGLAEGGTAMRAGAALVGERGPELLDMPRGASVRPLSSGGMGGGTTIINNYTTVTVEGSVVSGDEVWRLARQGALKNRRSNLPAGFS